MPNQNGNGRNRSSNDRDDDFDEAGRRPTEHYGGGQSGYGAGRYGEDRAMGSAFRNQQRSIRTAEDRQGIHTDDRWTGRGGQGYWEDRDRRDFAFGGGNVGQGPHRGKGPQGYTRSDQRIKEDVNDALTEDDHIDATHIEVVVKNGEVMLTGVVDDRRTKRMAEDVIERIPGVKDIQNQLRLTSNPIRDSAVGINETETSFSEKKPRA